MAWLLAVKFVSRAKHISSITAHLARNFLGSLGVTKRTPKGPSATKSLHQIRFCTTKEGRRYMSIATSNQHFSEEMIFGVRSSGSPRGSANEPANLKCLNQLGFQTRSLRSGEKLSCKS